MCVKVAHGQDAFPVVSAADARCGAGDLDLPGNRRASRDSISPIVRASGMSRASITQGKQPRIVFSNSKVGGQWRSYRDGNQSGYYPDRTGPDRTGYGFGPLTQIPGPGIYYPPSTRNGPNIPGPGRMYLYLVVFS
jgi:hypothetical protein